MSNQKYSIDDILYELENKRKGSGQKRADESHSARQVRIWEVPMTDPSSDYKEFLKERDKTKDGLKGEENPESPLWERPEGMPSSLHDSDEDLSSQDSSPQTEKKPQLWEQDEKYDNRTKKAGDSEKGKLPPLWERLPSRPEISPEKFSSNKIIKPTETDKHKKEETVSEPEKPEKLDKPDKPDKPEIQIIWEKPDEPGELEEQAKTPGGEENLKEDPATEKEDRSGEDETLAKDDGKRRSEGRLDPAYMGVYRDFKQNRMKRAVEFTLHEREEDEVDPDSSDNSENVQTEDSERRLPGIFDRPGQMGDEYVSDKQNDKIIANLHRTRKILKRRIGLMAILSILSIYISVFGPTSFAPSFLNIERFPTAHLFISLSILIVGALISLSTIAGGIIALIKLRPERDSLFSLMTAGVFVQLISMLFIPPAAVAADNVHIYLPVAILALLMNAVGKWLIIARFTENFLFFSEQGIEKYSVKTVEDEQNVYDMTLGLIDVPGDLAVNRKTSFFTRLMHYSYAEDLSDKASRILSPVSIISAIILFITTLNLTDSAAAAFTAASAALLFVCPISYLFPINFPLWKISLSATRHKSAVLGYDAAGEMNYAVSAAVEAHSLFPERSVVLKAIKTFSDKRIDDAILDAVSVLYNANSILSSVFLKIILGRKELLREVDSLIYEDLMGVSAWVNDKRVLIGNRELMIHHNINVPSVDYERRNSANDSELIYLSNSGELTALFIVGLEAGYYVKNELKSLEKNSIRLVVKSVDSMLSREKLSKIFQVDEKMFKILPARHHVIMEEETSYAPRLPGAVCNDGSFKGFVRSLIAAKRLRDTSMLGMTVVLASIVIGLIMLTGFVVAGALSQLSPLAALLYQGIFSVILFMVFAARR